MSTQSLADRMARLEGAYEHIAHQLSEIPTLFARLEERMDRRFTAIDQRFTSQDQRFTSIDERFGRIDEQFGRIDERFGRLEEKVDRHFLWVVGLIVLSIILPLVERFVAH